MNIILVSNRLGRARSITLSLKQVGWLGAGLLVCAIALAAVLHQFSLRFASGEGQYLPFTFVSKQAQENERLQAYMRDHFGTIAAKVGELQARMLRVDALGERLTTLAGLKPQDFSFDRVPGRGGAESTSQPSAELSMKDLGTALDKLARELEDRTDKLRVLESVLTEDNAKRQLVPTGMPTESGFYSSNFGWRIDPFTGLNAFHEGIDFSADEGTTILAAAGGVVVYAAFNVQYGNMIEIDHGNDMVTRYAHASKLLVKVGDVVLRGSKIAEVGNTGRSTGAHLHFEVRHRGAALNPARFLRMPG